MQYTHAHLHPTIVCDTCRMKIPTEVHAKAHQIVVGHETRVVVLDDQNREVIVVK